MKFRESGAAPCRGYGSACLEDGRVDRSPHPGFLENGPGSNWRTIPSVFCRQVLMDEVPGKTSSGKKFCRNVPILSEQQLVDSGTVDPGWDGELMDNVFVFAKKRTPCARRPVAVMLVSQRRVQRR